MKGHEHRALTGNNLHILRFARGCYCNHVRVLSAKYLLCDAVLGDGMLFRTYRYSRWDGTQNIFDLDADQLMDLLSDDILNKGDLMQALRDLLRQGVQNQDGQQMPGLRELMEQLKDRRRQQMQQHNMDSVLDDLKERLQDIIDTERRGIQNRLEEAGRQVENAS